LLVTVGYDLTIKIPVISEMQEEVKGDRMTHFGRLRGGVPTFA